MKVFKKFNKKRIFEACFELTESEIQQINQGGKVYVYVRCKSTPHICISTYSCVKAKQEIELTNKELEYLKSLAERDAVDRFTTSELTINMKVKDGK